MSGFIRSGFARMLTAALCAAALAAPSTAKEIVSAAALRDLSSTADHSKFKELQGPFNSGPEVTKACLSCHNKAGEQFKHNIHWTWKYVHPKTGQVLGKEHVINNFCTSANNNEGMCAQCHAGYGFSSPDYDWNKVENMDCLVCHDKSGKYFRPVITPGHPKVREKFRPKKPVPFTEAAQHVGMPGRDNCGKCHFYGGGGDNVKHGDLSSVLFNPPRDVDVHMSKDGANLACVDCHVGSGHKWAGSRYNMTVGDDGKRKPGEPRKKASCVSCHTTSPHKKNTIVHWKLNSHTDKVACETCHIPAFARGGVATKIFWDWSKAGKLKKDGSFYASGEYVQGNGKHRHTYASLKGEFKYGENVRPVYKWTNGVVTYTLAEEKIDPSKPVPINKVQGSYDDPKSRILPFKVMHTIQPYDEERKVLTLPHIWGDDDAAFWGNFDLKKAIAKGMELAGLKFSGKLGFVKTEMLWPINHMVAPKEQALKCEECHASKGRLADLTGFYMPGRDHWTWLEIIGWLMILGAVGIVILHSTARLLTRRNRMSAHTEGKE